MNKYRFWTGSEMLTEGFFINSDGTVWAWVDYRMTSSFVLKGKLLTFTGLISNGVEIYEGDAIDGTYKGGHIDYCENCKQFQYKIETFGCMACEGDVHWYELVNAASNNEISVKGNVFEKPELLDC